MTELAVLALVVAVLAAVRGLWSPCGLSMVSSLNPLAEHARGHRWSLTLGWHVAGATAGGAALGGCCACGAYAYGRLGPPPAVTWLVVAAGATLTLAGDLGVLRLPDRPRQVDQRWLTSFRRWVYAAGFGAQLGLGLATYVMTAATYLVAVLAILTGSPAAAVLVGVTYGAARGMTLLSAAGATTPQRLRRRLAGIERRRGRSLRVVEAAQLAVLAAAVTAFPAAGTVLVAFAAAALFRLRSARGGARTAGLRALGAPTLPRARAIR
jgi:hypothetical protein